MALHPTLQLALISFEKRRRNLLWIRAVMTFSTISLFGGLLALVLDSIFLLEDQTRFALLLVIAVSGLGMAWHLSIRRLGTVSPKATAELLEHAAKDLGGTLLSAVELSSEEASADSAEFRGILQRKAAELVSKLELKRVLPIGLLKRDAQALSCSALLVGAFLMVNEGPLGAHLTRLLLPFSNIELTADFTISIHSPSPKEGLVPANEEVEFDIEVHGPGTVQPVLQSTSGAGARTSLQLSAKGSDHFTAKLMVQEQPVEYRVQAGRSTTRKYSLQPLERPKVVGVSRTYRYPAYTNLPDRIEDGPDGNISAVEGTEVLLQVKTSEPIQSGTIRVAHGRESQKIETKLDREMGDHIQAQLKLQESGYYTIEALSAKSGFSSPAGIQYPIRVQLDLPPVIALDSPEERVLIPLGDTIKFSGRAEDDFGLVGLKQESRINQGGWRETAIKYEPGKEAPFAGVYDTLELSPKIGDIVTLRFHAVDGKGQRGDSRLVELLIGSPDTLPKGDPKVETQRDLTQQLKQLSADANDAVSAISKAKAESEKRELDSQKIGDALAKARQQIEKTLQRAETAREVAQKALIGAERGTEQADQAMVAQALNNVALGHLEIAKKAINQLTANADTPPGKADAAESLRFASEAAASAASLSNLAEDASKARLNLMESNFMGPLAKKLASEQRAILEPPDKTESTDSTQPATAPPAGEAPRESFQNPAETIQDSPSVRRQLVNQTASAQFQARLQKLSDRAPGIGGLRQATEVLKRNQTATEQALTKSTTPRPNPEPGASQALAKQRQQTAAELAKSLEHVSEALTQARPSLESAMQKANEALARKEQTAATTLAAAAQATNALNRRKQLSEDLRLAQTNAVASAQAELLRANADIEAVQTDKSPQLARALRQAADALEAPQIKTEEPTIPAARMLELSKLLNTIEAKSDLNVAKNRLEGVMAESANKQTSHPVATAQKRVAEQLKELPRKIRESGLPDDSATQVKAAERHLMENNPTALAKAVEDLKGADELAREPALRAMEALNAMAPSLDRRLESLASRAKQSAESTAQLAMLESDAKAKAGMKEAIANETQFQKKLDQLQKVLRDEANSEDQLSAESRNMARDADGASAMIRNAESAVSSLQKAQDSASERTAQLQKAAATQKKNAEDLQKLAGIFQKLAVDDADKKTSARQELRQAENNLNAGEAAKLAARKSRMDKLAELNDLPSAQAQSAIEGLLKKSEEPGVQPSTNLSTPSPSQALGSASQQQGAEPSGMPDTKKGTGSADFSKEAQAMLKSALAALKEEGESNPARAAEAIGGAQLAQLEMDRKDRFRETASPAGGSMSASGSLGKAENSPAGVLPQVQMKDSADWGNLPKRTAQDLLEANREGSPSEYRAAVEAYFRAVAEKARPGQNRP